MNELLLTVRQTIDEWLRLRWADLQFAEVRNTLLLFGALAGAAFVALLFRHARTRRRHSDTVRGAASAQAGAAIVLPAIVPSMRRSPLAPIRYLPLFVFLAGVPFFALGLADPHTGF